MCEESYEATCIHIWTALVCAQITGKPLVQACPGKSVVRWTGRPAMTIAVDLGRKASKPTNQPTLFKHNHFNFKLFIFVAILQVLKFEFQKFRIFRNFILSPMCILMEFSFWFDTINLG